MFCSFHTESMNGMMNFARMLRRMVWWNGLGLLKLALLPIGCKRVRMRSPLFYVVENYCSDTWLTCGLWWTKQDCHTFAFISLTSEQCCTVDWKTASQVAMNQLTYTILDNALFCHCPILVVLAICSSIFRMWWQLHNSSERLIYSSLWQPTLNRRKSSENYFQDRPLMIIPTWWLEFSSSNLMLWFMT